MWDHGPRDLPFYPPIWYIVACSRSGDHLDRGSVGT